MFRHVLAFEWRYQLKSPVFAVGSALFFLLTFGSVTVDQIQIGARGNTNINSPAAILQTQSIMSLFAVFVIVAMVSNVVIRDDETGFAPILRTTSVSKGAYLGGRFLGATAAALLVLASVPLGILVGSAMPWLDQEKVGPFHLSHYLYSIFVFGLPTLLIVSSALFALATATRSMMWTYVGALAALVLYVVTRGLLRDPRHDTVAALSDPFGLSALSIATKYWTASERNTRLPEMTGLLLYNRLLWGSISALFFGVAYAVFRFESRGKVPKAAASAGEDKAASIAKAQLAASESSGGSRFWSLARFDMAFVFRSPAFFVLLGIGALNSLGALWFAGNFYGTLAYPVTRLMSDALNGAFTLMPMIIAVYYSGELVWRDRDRKTHEIIDATSAPDWVFLVPKIAAISLVLASTSVAGVLTAIIVQLIRGGAPIDLLGYLTWFVWPMTVSAVLLAILSVFVQVLVPQKYIGWGVMLLYIVAQVALSSAGFEHKLYNYADSPPVPLSDMNRAGRFWVGQAWLHAYWTAFAVILASLSYALWRRGVTVALRPRLRQIRQRLRGPALVIVAGAFVAWVGIGAFVYYNTNILNHYETSPQHDDRLAEMEKALLPFKAVLQPRVKSVKLDVDLYPRETRAVTKGAYVLQNRTEQPISTLHIRWHDRLRIDEIQISDEAGKVPVAATIEQDFPRFHYRIYKLPQPMTPGASLTLSFATTLEEKGFPNSSPLTRIVENGTFLDNDEISPRIGMSEDALLRDRSKRRKHGLPEDLRLASLDDEGGRARNILRPDSDWVTADITVHTDADQTPIAPGETVSETTDGGRKTVQFRTDAPINHFFSIQSARYAVRADQQGDVKLAVYYQPGHEYNIDRMISTMKTSLTLFTERFSPYQFKQARILEFPAYADFAQSFANTIPYSENIGFLQRLGDPEKVDMVTYVTAHEIGHQWWGHQLLPSEQQGATMLVESFAQYSAMLVMEKVYGKDQIRRFLKFELDRYLRSRGGEVVEEVPLSRVENQPYIHYQKGALVMYWLKEVVGQDTVDRALSKTLARFGGKPSPYPNTRDFLKILREEAGPAHDALITDLFEKITLVDVKTTKATSSKRPDGKYDVSIEVDARKLYADGKGQETEAPLDEPFDVGVFTEEPGERDFTVASVLTLERRPLKSGHQTITLVVDKEPRYAGVDPYNKRIDRSSDDNLKPVEPNQN
ncbi:MAG: M1 family aminopeptidase [Polyangiaceae bacterium]